MPIRLMLNSTFSLVLLTTLMAGTAIGQVLSKIDVLRMQQEGIDKSILVKKINRDGINFQMTADVIVELKRAGVPTEVINSLLDARSAKAPVDATPSPSDSSEIKTLYGAGKYAEIVDRLNAHLSTDPLDHKSRAVLVTVFLKLHDRQRASSELVKLKQSRDTSASAFAGKLDSLIATLDAQEENKKNLETALRDYNTAQAETIVDKLAISKDQKAILNAYLDIYRARFIEARTEIGSIFNSNYSEIQQLQEKISKTETAYRSLIEKAYSYLYSPIAVSYCTSYPSEAKKLPEVDTFKIEEYLNVVNQLSQITPLDTATLNLLFHSQLIVSQGEQLESLGDRILRSTGKLQIPFYSSDRYFRLVIDIQKKRLSTASDDHAFLARYAVNGSHLEQNAKVNPYNGALIPFDLHFEEIQSIKQKAKAPLGVELAKGTFAVGVEPGGGVAPRYAFMGLLVCKAGEAAELKSTNNLGMFLVHVINKPNLRAELADPAKAHSNEPSAWGAIFTGLYNAAPQHTALQQLAMQSIQTQNAQMANVALQQNAAWYSIMTNESFAVIEPGLFRDFEELVDLI